MQERSIGPDHNAGLQQQYIIPFEDSFLQDSKKKEKKIFQFVLYSQHTHVGMFFLRKGYVR